MSIPPKAPTRRDRPFLTTEWRHLIFFNYTIAPEILAPLVPDGVTLDIMENRAWVSIVGLWFYDTRVLGMPIPLHADFDEVNFRFYVRRACQDGTVRRGITFIREFVSKPAIAYVARATYNEPYRTVPTRSTVPAERTSVAGRMIYEWKAVNEWHHLEGTATGQPAVPAPASMAALLTQRYWGYTRQRDGSTIEYEVRHPPWQLWSVDAPELKVNVPKVYGPEFAQALSAPPASVMIADGSPVVLFRAVEMVNA